MNEYKALDRHQIPHKVEYTDKLVKLLMRISETKPYLEQYLGQPLEVQLLRQAKILAITYSNQIEGNQLDIRGVTKTLNDKNSPTDNNDIIEVRNYDDALKYIESLSMFKLMKIN